MSGNFARHFSSPLAGSKARRHESLALAMAQKMKRVSRNKTGLLPMVTSKVCGMISFRHKIFPSKSSAASTDEPNKQNTRLPSVAGVGAA